MHVKFIKDHPSGIEKGHCASFADDRAEVLISDKFVKEIKEKELEDFVLNLQIANEKEKAKILKEQEIKIKKQEEAAIDIAKKALEKANELKSKEELEVAKTQLIALMPALELWKEELKSELLEELKKK